MTTFDPDYAIAPGEILKEALGALGLTPESFALAVGFDQETLDQILRGERTISTEDALMFERTLGLPKACFWIKIESNYQARKVD